MSTMCMKIGPGMHIGLHFVFFGKTGVTVLILDPYCCQTLRRRMNRCLYRRFILWSVLNPLAIEIIRRM
jgi:hypothetical protein